MSAPFAFINKELTTYATLKRGLNLGTNARAKFDVLNRHIFNDVVVPGQIVIVGDDSTQSCTREEAAAMHQADLVSQALIVYPSAGDGFLVKNYDLLQSLLAYGSIGIGSSTGAWNKHLNQVKQTLEEVEALHRQHRGQGASASTNDFIAKRQALFAKLDVQLEGVARYGTGLKKDTSIKHMLGISTKSYLHTGEISGYADKIKGIARLSNALKNGVFVGLALDLANGALEIQEACSMGREEQCEKAKFIEPPTFFVSISGAYGGGVAGEKVMVALCSKSRRRYPAVMLGCSIIGSVVGGLGGGAVGGSLGNEIGDILYQIVHDG
ncbi:MAG: hypothetical protein ACOH2R_01420 [Pseudomonas sp.]